MTADGHRARRPRRLGLAAAIALALCVLPTGCGSSAGGTTNGSGAAAAAHGPSAIPTQDVVSGIRADAKLMAELPAGVRSGGKLILGTTLTPGTSGLPHAGQTSDGTDIGLDVDLRNAVAKVLGIGWDVRNGTFATIIPGVQNGRYQVGQDNFGVTKARTQVVDFATYLSDGQAFLGAASVGVDRVTSLTDICGYTVATSPGSTFQQILSDGAGKCSAAGKKPYTVQYFADPAPIFLGLANGKVDIYFGPTLSLRYDAAHVANTRFLGQISSTPVGFVTAKGSPLARALSDAVNELIADGDYSRIFAKWAVPGTGITRSAVNPPTSL